MKIGILEAAPIAPTVDAGSRALLDFYYRLEELGHEVRFIYETEPNFVEKISSFRLDLMMISRPGLFRRTHQMLSSFKIPKIYIAQDLHFVRLRLQSELIGDRSKIDVKVAKLIESFCVLNSTYSLFPTSSEAEYINDMLGTSKAIAIKYFGFFNKIPKKHKGGIKQLIFVGSAAHMPNRDGVTWFIENVWPDIKKSYSNLQFKVVGDWTLEDSRELLRPGIDFTGVLTEDELETVISTSDIGISPLRFGAGMKRKTLHYMSLGLPVVTTSFGIEGVFSGISQGIVLAESKSEWVEAINLVNDESTRAELGFQARNFIQKEFSIEKQRVDLDNLIKLATINL